MKGIPIIGITHTKGVLVGAQDWCTIVPVEVPTVFIGDRIACVWQPFWPYRFKKTSTPASIEE